MKKTLYYRDFCVSADAGYNLARAMQACRREGAARLVLEPILYDVYPDRCEERVLYISNHGQNGPKRLGALMEDMQDFELDMNGATLRVHGDMTHLAILRSSRITVKNGNWWIVFVPISKTAPCKTPKRSLCRRVWPRTARITSISLPSSVPSSFPFTTICW